MKKTFLLLFLFAVQVGIFAQEEYYPEGTKWTEIRLDTLKYDSWYSKVDGEWVPNFETIEYRVLGIYSNFSETFGDNSLKCVYTNCSEWTDSLSLLIVEGKINEYLNYGRRVMATVPIYFDTWDVPSPAMAYNFDWRVGMPISFIDILSTTYDHNSETAVFGIIEEINEGNFGGVRPLSYTDVNGVRFIQGIGVTTWNDGECIFGPVKPYEALSAYGAIEPEERHYRSMLVHFERDGEVLYDVWPEKPYQPLSFLEGNPIWVYKHEHMPEPEDSYLICWLDTGDRYFTYYFLGDKKEIEGRVYTMMGEVTSNGEEELTVSRWLPVREENGIVYTITDSLPGVVEYCYDDEYYPLPYLRQENECVLYNFNTEIGETLYPQNKWGTVESYDTYQLMGGTVCRVLKTTSWGYYDLYERLGYVNFEPEYGVMDPLCGMHVPTNGHVYVKHLNAFYQNNVMLYKAPDAPDGLCVNDTCWTRDDAEAYAVTYKADPYHDEVMSFIRQLQGVAEPITYTEGQMATIILPEAPDASKGKYYRLDRIEEGKIIFEQELQPRARVPYIIVPNEDFSIDLSTLDLQGLQSDTVSVDGISFIGSYVSKTFDYQEGFYIEIIDTTPDCRYDESCVIGALRAYLLVHWDDPYNQGGTKVPPLERLEIVLRDDGTGIKSIDNGQLIMDNSVYDLSGRKIINGKLPQGIYIEEGKKRVAK